MKALSCSLLSEKKIFVEAGRLDFIWIILIEQQSIQMMETK